MQAFHNKGQSSVDFHYPLFFACLGLKTEKISTFSRCKPVSNNFDLKPFQGAGYLSKGLAVELIILLEHIYDSAPLKFAVQCHYKSVHFASKIQITHSCFSITLITLFRMFKGQCIFDSIFSKIA